MGTAHRLPRRGRDGGRCPPYEAVSRSFPLDPHVQAEGGEEAVEAIIEAVKGDRTRLTAEAADVIFHLLVMLAARDLTLAEVEAELDRRAGTSGIAEKATRPS